MQKRITSIVLITTIGVISAVGANAQTTDTKILSEKVKEKFQKMSQNLNDSQKAAFAQAKTLMDAGKSEEARALLQKAGVSMHKNGNKEQSEHKNKSFGIMKQDPQEIDNAIISGDFAKFQTLVKGGPLEKVDLATFNLLKAPTEARRNAHDQIQTILKNAGVTFPQKHATGTKVSI